jgi:hypothetical protein
MLGSQHAGEGDNAAMAIERLRRELGFEWGEVLRAPRLGFTVPQWPVTGPIVARGELPE